MLRARRSRSLWHDKCRACALSNMSEGFCDHVLLGYLLSFCSACCPFRFSGWFSGWWSLLLLPEPWLLFHSLMIWDLHWLVGDLFPLLQNGSDHFLLASRRPWTIVKASHENRPYIFGGIKFERFDWPQHLRGLILQPPVCCNAACVNWRAIIHPPQ